MWALDLGPEGGDHGGELVETKIIEVNHPLTYKGYMFYQHSYDKEHEEYTILEVNKDPGWWWVMLGFVLLTLGLIKRHYLNPLLKRKEAANRGNVGLWNTLP